MDKKKRVGFQSSLLVSTGVIVGAFCASLLAWWVDAAGVAVLLMASAAAGLVSRLWGFYALKNVEVSVQAERETISAGRSVTIHYTLHNDKALPLVWMELCQDVPMRGCLVPDGSFQLRTFSEEEAAYTGRKDAYMRRFSFFMGWSELGHGLDRRTPGCIQATEICSSQRRRLWAYPVYRRGDWSCGSSSGGLAQNCAGGDMALPAPRLERKRRKSRLERGSDGDKGCAHLSARRPLEAHRLAHRRPDG